ncbi:MAG: hypothetical protein D6681_16730 [Calditrichaeota bacterium]|nr:MAG: hypothetical protein D6681_16730 [Calditrichota bacterium]
MSDREQVYEKILRFMCEQDNFLVTTHLNADGDAYGSALAVAYFLEAKGKKYHVVFHDQEREEKYSYLWGWDKILSYTNPWPHRYDAAIVVDVPTKARIGDPAALLPEPNVCVKIDHHPMEEDFSQYNLVDVAASSTCQLVYEILVRSDIPFDVHLSSLLFSGIMYDTGRFSFSNTNQRDFEIAADLVSHGTKPNVIANHLFFSHNIESLRTIGMGLANMEAYLEGKVCVIYLPLEVMQNARHLDLEELANYSLAVKGVEVGLFIREAEPNFVKVSFRSKGNVDVNRVARVFGGGGHVHAAGCRASGDPLELKERIIAEIARQL